MQNAERPHPQHTRPFRFRFGVVGAPAAGDAWLDHARRVEALGYDTLVVPDNLNHVLAPLPALAAAGAVTSRLRLGTYVLVNDFRSPVLVAKDAATLDVLTGGRVELGLGAGRPGAEAEYRMLGLPFERGGRRVDRLGQALEIIGSLLAGERVNADGPSYHAGNAAISPLPLQAHLPLLVAGSGRRLLSLAARRADIVALGVRPDEGEAAVAEKIGWLQEAAPDRFGQLELNLNLMAVGGRMPRYLSAQLGLDAEKLARSGAVAAISGSVDEMAAQLQNRRERLGISYFMVSHELMDAFAPVVARLAGS